MFTDFNSILSKNNENTSENNIVANAIIGVLLEKVMLKLSEKRIAPSLAKKIKQYLNCNLKNVSYLSKIIDKSKISTYKSPELSTNTNLENSRMDRDNWMRHQIPEKISFKGKPNIHLDLSFKGNLFD